MRYTPRRTLLLAVFVSLLLHAAALLGVVLPSPPQSAAPMLTLQLVARDRVPPTPASAPPAPDRPASDVAKPPEPVPATKELPKSGRKSERKSERKSRPKSEPKNTPKAAPPAVLSPPPTPLRVPRPPVSPAPKPSLAPPPDSPLATADAPPLAAASPAVAKPSPTVSPSPTPGRDQTAPAEKSRVISAEALRQFRVALGDTAERYKRYPALARERGWEGVTEISITLRKNASAPLVALSASSGHTLLDDQALEIMRQAANATLVPGPLRDADFSVRMPVKFRLGE
ncbi:MAG: TonB family protein [Propionivibrio sp.]